MTYSPLTTTLLLLLATVSQVFADDSPPNVVLIFADDLGYGDLGCYGATKVQTPNIDRLAREGRRFMDAHSVSAVCTPSRYALLTGQYPVRGTGPRGEKGIWGPSPVTARLLVDTEKTTIADVFKSKGYDTAAFGKWHLGFGKEKNTWREPLRPGPNDLGFDYYFGMPVVNSAPPYVYVENDRVVGSDPNDPLVHLGRNAKGVTPITPIPKEAANRSPNQFGGATKAHELFNDYQVGTTLAKKSVEWINEHKGNPFFLYMATTNIHHPFTPAKQFQGTSQCGLYGDFIHELDWIVGEILSCLEENGLTDNTLVIFTSDNGGMFNFGGQAAFKAGHRQNGDLLGFKFGVWEGGHRVPMIVRWPGKVKAGTTSNQLIGNVDMLATFAALTGQELDTNEQIDSVNVLPAFVDDPQDPIRDHLLLAPHKGTHLSVRKGKWMYIPARGSGGFGGKTPKSHTFAGPAAATFVGSVNSDIENGRIKKDAPRTQLYDLEADVNETKNVINEHPDVVEELSALLAEYRPNRRTARTRGTKKTPNDTPTERSGRSKPSNFESGKADAPQSVAASPSQDPDSKPNFVIIFTDDQGYGDLSCYGAQHVSTPRIDQMAAEGAKLTSFYVAAPVCTPSRAALMTGCYPKRIGMAKGSTFGVLLAGDTKGLNPNEITIAEVLKPVGYKTGMFGKWHLGDEPEFLPTRQGFDEFFGLPYSHDIPPFHHKQSRFNFPPLPLLENETVIEMDPDADYLTKRFTERAVQFIEQNKDEPFFLYIPHPIPHVPLHVSPPFMADVGADVKMELDKEDGNIDYPTRDRLFRQAIAEIDWSVGQILDALKTNGVDENTLVIFTSDNGPGRWRTTEKLPPHAGPLRGRKGTTFEGGMREPTVIRWPGKIPAGKDNDELMTAMDLLPTFARLAGAEIPTDRIIDGKDIWATLAGQAKTPHDVFFYHRNTTLQAVRSGKWKLHTNKGRPTQLYDLETDIGETNNVIKSHPEVVKKLNRQLKDFAKDIADNNRPAAFVENPKPLSK